MIKIENVEIAGWEPAIRVLHSSNNSREESDSERKYESWHDMSGGYFNIGPNDLNLIASLRNSDTGRWEFMQMITVYLDITAPSYWWSEFDACRVCAVTNPYSMMHQIVGKEFTLEDFSREHLTIQTKDKLENVMGALNCYRNIYLNWERQEEFIQRIFEYDKKEVWWQMIHLLPSSYNQKRTIMISYESLANIYKNEHDHKLDEYEWYKFYKWVESLPYSGLITGKENNDVYTE